MIEKNDTKGWRKKMFLFLNLDQSHLQYENVDFDIICTDVVYPAGEKLSLFTHFCSNQRFIYIYIYIYI